MPTNMSNHGCSNILITGSYIFRRGLGAILSDLAPDASIAESPHLRDAQRRLDAEEFFAAIFDADTEDLRGPDELELLRADHPGLILGIVSRTHDPNRMLGYLAAGVNGYIAACSDQPEIERAIGTMLRAPVRFSSTFVAGPADHAVRSVDARLPGREPAQLTVRQTGVLGLLVDGHSNKQIARMLGLSPHTVIIHVAALLRHFGVSRRTDLSTVARGRRGAADRPPLAATGPGEPELHP
jgi:DNA-binding NarL/FixJ family response regulator